ncbi:MAG: Inner membrane protein YrbG [Promethearchaeota archaeon]|nr:MAG: Inner membrane protein YrbG [Candidatus Lokiarchaeota archaeon]
MLIIFIAFLILIGSIILMIFSSNVAVKHSAALASSLGISSLIIGITLVSIGTDVSEIFNSIISCALGHGDIDVADSVGSDLTQLTLVFGLLPIICGSFMVNRKQFLIIGSCEVLSLILIFTVVEKGYFTRLDALFMMLSFIFYMMVTYNVTKSDMLTKVDLMIHEDHDHSFKRRVHFLVFAIIGFGGVTISSYLIVQSIIYLSTRFNISEFILSFFLLSIGTSLPELSVDITALRKKEYTLAIGDIIGSCIVDSTISIAIGQFLFPQSVSAHLAIPAILYTIIASLIVIIVVSKRQIMDWKSGILFITIYIIGFPILLFIFLHS